ncbi:MAG: hypothetical protein D6722_20530, partial [Bacteroidetes bacterium]
MERKKHEIAGLAVFVLALILLLSLISFDSRDLTLFSASGLDRPAQNWVGTLGAHLAWLLFFVFGLGAFGFPALGLWLAYALFWGRRALPYGKFQIAGLCLLLLSAISLLALYQPEILWFGQPLLAGGKLGLFIAGWFQEKANTLGTSVLLSGALGIALVMATPFSFKAAGRLARQGLTRLARAIFQWVRTRSWRRPRPLPALAVRRPRARPGTPRSESKVELLTAPLEPQRKSQKSASTRAARSKPVQNHNGYALPGVDLLYDHPSEVHGPDPAQL